MTMARSLDASVPPDESGVDREQERRIRRAQKQLSDAAHSLYLAHRELEMALRLHSLTPTEVQTRIQELLGDA